MLAFFLPWTSNFKTSCDPGDETAFGLFGHIETSSLPFGLQVLREDDEFVGKPPWQHKKKQNWEVKLTVVQRLNDREPGGLIYAIILNVKIMLLKCWGKFTFQVVSRTCIHFISIHTMSH